MVIFRKIFENNGICSCAQSIRFKNAFCRFLFVQIRLFVREILYVNIDNNQNKQRRPPPKKEKLT
ncbi:hypothetical protein DERP_008456 [Dermatophagoides pteronyssinus]|uniref:Uncharacterized protein n=1 Tax=Dermatophagoides pteronyssinus TaxID=6956 RepID=A0ABQ8IVB7_DERPT|nr:hypothetical protein DERP_008456 [Dermatophagoides pteronyssinus]